MHVLPHNTPIALSSFSSPSHWQAGDTALLPPPRVCGLEINFSLPCTRQMERAIVVGAQEDASVIRAREDVSVIGVRETIRLKHISSVFFSDREGSIGRSSGLGFPASKVSSRTFLVLTC